MWSSSVLYGVIKKINIEMNIMAEQNGISDKSAQRSHDFVNGWSICYHAVGDPIIKRYKGADRTRGFYEGFVCLHFVAVLVTDGGYFDDFIPIRIKASCLNIDSNKLIWNFCSTASFERALLRGCSCHPLHLHKYQKRPGGNLAAKFMYIILPCSEPGGLPPTP